MLQKSFVPGSSYNGDSSLISHSYTEQSLSNEVQVATPKTIPYVVGELLRAAFDKVTNLLTGNSKETADPKKDIVRKKEGK